MQVYLVIEFGGYWEDYYEHIIGCYANYQVALDKKLILEEDNVKYIEQNTICNQCPCCYGADKKDFSKALCKNCKMEKDSFGNKYYCENAISLYDEKNYKIKRVEVIE